MLDKLRLISQNFLELNINNEVNYNKYRLINNILCNNNCFFEMDIKTAYSILRDLGIEENELKNVYMDLIDSKNV